MRTCRECVRSNECFTHGSHCACGEFISKNIVPKDLSDKYPTLGGASYLKFGKAGRSQFARARYESA